MKLVSVIDMFYTFLHFCQIFSIFNCPVPISYMTPLTHLRLESITLKVLQLRQLHLILTKHTPFVLYLFSYRPHAGGYQIAFMCLFLFIYLVICPVFLCPLKRRPKFVFVCEVNLHFHRAGSQPRLFVGRAVRPSASPSYVFHYAGLL